MYIMRQMTPAGPIRYTKTHSSQTTAKWILGRACWWWCRHGEVVIISAIAPVIFTAIVTKKV